MDQVREVILCAAAISLITVRLEIDIAIQKIETVNQGLRELFEFRAGKSLDRAFEHASMRKRRTL